ncbi:3-methyl-2-oxobutanoate hydroxymethyltransferase [Halorutilales archaeon Cl-col2-1]
MTRTSVNDLRRMKENSEKITMLTAYDAPTAEILDGEVEILLVGDSVGNTRLGYDTTLPVTIDEMVSHTGAVSRGSEESMVVADMPFVSVGASVEKSVENAGRLLKEADANAVKIETPPGGEVSVEVTERLVEIGIPVMGHIGLTPQRINQMGGHRIQGRDSETADLLVETGRKLEEAGVFCLVVEGVPEGVAGAVTDAIDVPTIGIGAGRHVDGQVLVIDDLIGLSEDSPSFVKEYADVRSTVEEAAREYAEDVKKGEFPAEEHVFGDET